MFGASGPAPTLAFAPIAPVAPIVPAEPASKEANKTETNSPAIAAKPSTSDLAIN